MSLKKILIIAGALVVIIGLTIGVLVITKPRTGTQGNETPRGIKPTDNFVFNDMSSLRALPTFATLPSEQNGWKKVSLTENADFASADMSSSNSCLFSAQSQQVPFAGKLKDYALSKAYATTIAAAELGTVSDEYIIKIKTSKDDADFYSGIYSPKISLTHPEVTTRTDRGGSVPVPDGSYKTFIAVRSIASAFKTVPTNITPAQPNDSKYKPGEIIAYGGMIPQVVLKYSCKTSDFDVSAALKFIQQVKLNLSPAPTTTTSTSSATVGK